jgi:hypothetical protein
VTKEGANVTETERENLDGNHGMTLLGCTGCGTAWLSRAVRLLLENEDRCLRCRGPLEARD